MNIDITKRSVNHAKLIAKEIRSNNKLPFTDVLSAEVISEKINSMNYRARIFTPGMTIFAFLAQVMGSDQSCQTAVAQVIAHFVSHHQDEPSSSTAAYCKARARLPEEILSTLSQESATSLEAEVNPAWLWRNRHIKMPDGTTVSMPDTSANQAMYPQPRSQKKGLVSRWREWLGYFLWQRVPYLI